MFHTLEFLSCHLRGTTKIHNSELHPFDDEPKFLPFCILFSSLLVREKILIGNKHSLEIFFVDNLLNAHTHYLPDRQ